MSGAESVRDAQPDGTAESLAVCAQMLETYGPECFPANEQGQVHFARCMMDSAAAEIRAFLASAALSTPQPESVEVEHDLIERLLNAQQDINLAANERMDQSLCDASALIDEIEPILRAALTAMPAETTQPGPGSWVPADQFVALRHERDGLRAALAEAIEALGPFAEASTDHDGAWLGVDEDDFRRAAQVVAKHGGSDVLL